NLRSALGGGCPQGRPSLYPSLPRRWAKPLKSWCGGAVAMGQRWGVGPVFTYEWLMASRRWQLYALRAVVIALLGVGLTIVWWKKAAGQPLTISRLAATGESFFYALVGIQLALVLLAAPAYTAGAVCLDRARGTLLHLLATDLSDA